MPSVAAVREDRSWIPVVERGCCCSLEGCCKVQASLVVALSLLYAPTLLIEYLQPQSASIRCQSFDREKGVHRLFQAGEPTLACEWERRGHAGSAKMAEMVVKMLLQAIAFSSALLFLIGIQRRRHKLLLPYVRVLGVQMLFNAVDLLVRACVYNLWAEAVLVILPLGIGIPYYMWICAYSLYRKMKLSAEFPMQPHIVAHLPPQFMQDTTVLPPLPPGYGYAPPVVPNAPIKPDDLPPPYHLVVAADEAAAGAVAGSPRMGAAPWSGVGAAMAPPVGPGMAPGMGPGMGPGMAPGMAPAVGPGTGPGMAPGMGPAMGPGMAPGMAPGMGPGMAPGMGPAVGPGMGPGIGPGPAAGVEVAGPAAYAGPPKPADPNMPSAV